MKTKTIVLTLLVLGGVAFGVITWLGQSTSSDLVPLNSNSPDVLWLQRRFLADQLAFVPGFPVLIGFHDRLLGC